MLRGCLLSLALYAALAVGYFFWLDPVLDSPENYIAAGVVGFITLCCLGALGNARTAWKTWSLVKRATQHDPPRDGRLAAFAGTIHPTAKPLTAPFSEEPCVICEYDLASPSRVSRSEDQHNTGSDYAGFLMTPCVIRSPRGEVRLLGYPILEGFEEEWRHSYEAARNARKFLASTQFEDRAGLKLVTVLSVFGEVWSDDDGRVEKHLKLSKLDPQTLFPPELQADLAHHEQEEKATPTSLAVSRESTDQFEGDEVDDEGDLNDSDFEDDAENDLTPSIPKMTEKRVAVGEQVCAIGVYHELQRGLRPNPGGRHPTRLVRGDADQIIARSRASLLRNLVGGLLVLILVHAVIYGLMQAYRNSPEGQRQRSKQEQAVMFPGLSVARHSVS